MNKARMMTVYFNVSDFSSINRLLFPSYWTKAFEIFSESLALSPHCNPHTISIARSASLHANFDVLFQKPIVSSKITVQINQIRCTYFNSQLVDVYITRISNSQHGFPLLLVAISNMNKTQVCLCGVFNQ